MARRANNPSEFGNLLRSHRRLAGLTQETLAELAGYSTVYISMLERGERVPHQSTIDALAGALRLSPRERTALAASIDASESTQLLGRAVELGAIQDHLAGSGPPVLLLSGEPGIGKSALLTEARRLAPVHGWTVLEAGCGRRGGQEPFAPLPAALRRYMRESTSDRGHAGIAGFDALRILLPETIPPETRPAAALPDTEIRLMVHSLVCFLETIRGPAGTLLILDDLQWAGSDIFDVLHSVLEFGGPIRIVAAYREVDMLAVGPLARWLGDLTGAGWVTNCPVSSLPGADAVALLEALLVGVPNADATLLAGPIESASGVPLFLVSYAQELRRALLSGRLPDAVPWDIAHTIRRRVTSLPEGAIEVLDVASVIGRSFHRQTLLDVTNMPGDELNAVLDAACSAGLIAEGGVQSYRFYHDVIREVVESDLTASRRARIHRDVADALASSGSTEDLAYHYAHAGMEDLAITHLEAAGDGARARHAHAAAEGYYREAVDLLQSRGGVADRARLTEKLGATQLDGGQFDAALESLEGAARLYRQAGDRESEWLSVARIGRLHARRGTAREGIDRLNRIRVVPHPPMPRAEAAVDIALAPLYLAAERFVAQHDAAARAARCAHELGDMRLLAEAEVWRGCALNQLGHLQEGRAVQEAAITLAEEVSELSALTHALNDVGFLTEVGGEFEVSRHFKQRALELAEQFGDPVSIATMTFRCGQNAFLRGDWMEARDLFDRGMRSSRTLGRSSISAYPPFGHALLALASGDLEAARAFADQSRQIAGNADGEVVRAALAVLADCELRDGRPEAAIELIGDSSSEAQGLGLHPVQPVRSEVLRALGRRGEALVEAEDAISHARRRHNVVALVDALRARALSAEPDRAASDIEEGLETVARIGYPYGEVRLLEVRATLWADAASLQRARRVLGMLREGSMVAGQSRNGSANHASHLK